MSQPFEKTGKNRQKLENSGRPIRISRCFEAQELFFQKSLHAAGL